MWSSRHSSWSPRARPRRGVIRFAIRHNASPRAKETRARAVRGVIFRGTPPSSRPSPSSMPPAADNRNRASRRQVVRMRGCQLLARNRVIGGSPLRRQLHRFSQRAGIPPGTATLVTGARRRRRAARSRFPRRLRLAVADEVRLARHAAFGESRSHAPAGGASAALSTKQLSMSFPIRYRSAAGPARPCAGMRGTRLLSPGPQIRCGRSATVAKLEPFAARTARPAIALLRRVVRLVLVRRVRHLRLVDAYSSCRGPLKTTLGDEV